MSNLRMAVLFLIIACGCQPMGAQMPDDAKTMDGTWKPVTAELGGQAMPESFLSSITLKLSDGKYEAIVAGESDRGTSTLDATANPKRLTIVGTDGPNKGKTFLAIYEITGDPLRVCYDLSGKSFPADFKTAAGTQLYLVTYKRVPTGG